ncbi:MAG: hypothetical protein ACI841_004242, partial [Planctomycetota bacterium]
WENDSLASLTPSEALKADQHCQLPPGCGNQGFGHS